MPFPNELPPAVVTAPANTSPINASAVSVGGFPASSLNPIAGIVSSGASNYGSGIVSGALGFLGSILQRRHERKEAEKQRTWNEQMMDKQNAWSLEQWNRTNEYNSPSEQVARLRVAGLNPLNYGLDGTSANSFESAQPLGYERANIAGISNPLQAGLEGFMSARSMQKDIELKNAQIDKIKADTAGVGLDNEFKDKTMDARVESERLANSLTNEQIETFKKQRALMDKDISLRIEQAKSEVEKQALIAAQAALNRAQAGEIAALLPYRRLLLQAQTMSQKASAAASFAHALYESKLIKSGYIESLNHKMQLEIEGLETANERAEGMKVREAWITALKTGEVLQFDSPLAQGVADVLLNYPLKSLSVFGSVLDELGPALFAGAVGKGVKGLTKSTTAKVTNLVDEYGKPLSVTRYDF